MDNEPVLNDDDVNYRVTSLRNQNFPAEDTITAAEQISQYARGPVAEAVVIELVAHLPETALSDLVLRHLMPSSWSTLPSQTDFCSASHVVWERLGVLGYQVHETSADGWKVIAPDGETVVAPFRSNHTIRAGDEQLPGRGEALCRLALRTVWLRQMGMK